MPNLTVEQIQEKFVDLTNLLLGIDVNTKPDAVRQAYAQDGQPFQPIDADIIYIYALPVDDMSNRQVNTEWADVIPMDDEPDEYLVTETKSYNRVISTQWVFYGPLYIDNAQKLRLRLFSETAKQFYADNDIKLITNVSEVRREPELFQGRWWNRCDFSAQFNTRFEDTVDIETVGTVGIVLNNEGNETNIEIENN